MAKGTPSRQVISQEKTNGTSLHPVYHPVYKLGLETGVIDFPNVPKCD